MNRHWMMILAVWVLMVGGCQAVPPLSTSTPQPTAASLIATATPARLSPTAIPATVTPASPPAPASTPIPTPTSTPTSPPPSPTPAPSSATATLPLLTWSRAENPDYQGDWQVWGAMTGVDAILPDGDILWLATGGGLLALNTAQNTLTQYLYPYFPLPGNRLEDLLALDGQLVISGEFGVSIWDKQDAWKTYSPEEIGLEFKFSAPLARVGDTLWVGGEDGLARLTPEGRWEAFAPREFEEWSLSKFVVEKNKLFLVMDKGYGDKRTMQVFSFDEGKMTAVERPDLDTFRASNGDLWRGGRDMLERSSDGGVTWRTIIIPGGDEGNWFEALAEDDQGRIYARSIIPSYIFVIQGDEVIATYALAHSDAPEINYINILTWDDAHRLWVATDGRGLTMFDGERWRNWQPENSDLRDDAIRAMLVTEDKVYAGVRSSAASGGLSVLDIATETWTNYWPEESPLSYGGVGGLAQAKDGRIFMMTSDGKLNILDHDQWSYVTMPIPENTLPTYTDGFFDPTGVYWVATEAIPIGVWGYDGERWMNFRLPLGINAMVLDKQRRLWLGTQAGLIVRDITGKWHYYDGQALGLAQNGPGWISDLAVDDQGRVWITNFTDLLIFNGEEIQHIDPALVGASSWGDAITFDKEGRAWMRAGDLLVRFDGEPTIGPFAGLKLPSTQSFTDKDIQLIFPAR